MVVARRGKEKREKIVHRATEVPFAFLVLSTP